MAMRCTAEHMLLLLAYLASIQYIRNPCQVCMPVSGKEEASKFDSKASTTVRRRRCTAHPGSFSKPHISVSPYLYFKISAEVWSLCIPERDVLFALRSLLLAWRWKTVVKWAKQRKPEEQLSLAPLILRKGAQAQEWIWAAILLNRLCCHLVTRALMSRKETIWLTNGWKVSFHQTRCHSCHLLALFLM